MLPRARSKKTVVIADIGSGSVGVAIAQIHTDGSDPVIAVSERVHLPISERTPAQTIPGLTQALRDAAGRVLTTFATLDKRLFNAPNELYIIAHAPWAESRNIIGQRALEHETVITDSLIAKISQETVAADTSIQREKFLEATVSRILINGYETRVPHGKRGRELRVDILVSECDAALKQSITDTIGAIFPALKPLWRTHTRAVIRALGEHTLDANNCVVVEVGSEATTIVVIRKGHLESQETTEGGSRAFLTAVSSGGLPEETLSLIKMIEKDECTSEACQRVAAQLATEESTLIHEYGEVLARLSTKRRLPNKMLVLTRPELLPWFARFFARLDFAQFTVPMLPFSIGHLFSEKRGTASAGVVEDTALYVGALLVNSDAAET